MKIADLLDEHDYQWFKHADLLFGVLWGLAGGYLILQNGILATIWISVLFCFIVRFRLDYLNHGIAAGTWFILMLYIKYNVWDHIIPFVFFSTLFTISGLIHDYFQYNKPLIKGVLKFFFIDFKLYWYIIALIYSIYYSEWLPILTIWPFEFFYDLISSGKGDNILKRLGFEKRNY